MPKIIAMPAPKKPGPAAAFFSIPGALECLEDNLNRLALEETKLGASCRLVLKLRRDGGTIDEQKRAMTPLMREFIRLIYTPAEELIEVDGMYALPAKPARKKVANA